MEKINWVNILHFYQPPYQSTDYLKKITKQSYFFIWQSYKNNSPAKLTVNFNGSLTELLIRKKLNKIIKNLSNLAKDSQVEFLETAKYHPILPLLPDHEVERQIKLNYQINRSYFGSVYSPKGFFCPEMAYSENIGKIIKKLGYKYVVLDEIALNGNLKPIDPNFKYVDKKSGLEVIFRNRVASKAYPPAYLLSQFKKNKAGTIITATDAEMYGFYHKDTTKSLNKILKDKGVNVITASQYLQGLKQNREISVINSCWENTPKDIAEKRPYKIWKNSKNLIHNKLWELAYYSIELNKKYDCEKNCAWARKHLDRGLSSCSWWWASQKKLDVFSPISWNPDDIEKGANELIRSVRSIDQITLSEILNAENIYSKLIQAIWNTHWKKTKK